MYHSPAAVSNRRQYRSPHIACVFARDTNSRWSFYLMSMPGEVKRPHTGVIVYPVVDSVILEKGNSENQARQYSSHRHVADTEWWANHKKKKIEKLEMLENRSFRLFYNSSMRRHQ